MTPWVNNLSGVRTFRVLRALKTISTVKGKKVMFHDYNFDDLGWSSRSDDAKS